MLCKSIDLCIPEQVDHVLVVDRRDVSAFAPLQTARRKILAVEDLLPRWIARFPFARRWWINLQGIPIRNWVLQQIVKIQAAASVGSDAVLFVDSDVTFVRPFSPDRLERNGLVALHRVGFSSEQHSRWLRNAESIIGVSHHDSQINYIGNLVSWRVDVAKMLIRHLESRHNRHWIHEFTSNWQVAEYMVYGVFAERVLGLDAAGHFVSDVPFIHLCWNYDLTDSDGMDRFFSDLPMDAVAIMIHSKNGIDPARYMPYLEDHWRNLGS